MRVIRRIVNGQPPVPMVCVWYWAAVTGLLTPATACGMPPQPHEGSPAERFTYRTIAQFPHDSDAFTQGLEWRDGELYESTGLHGQSTLRQVDMDTGEVLQQTRLDPWYFGEGITVLGDRIYQLTWQSRTGFIYGKETFELIDRFTYDTEGWGLTNDGARLIMSDGTAAIHFLDPISLERTGGIDAVEDAGLPVTRLNELEYAEGMLYANVWKTDYIIRIDIETGSVTGWIDLSGLLPDYLRTSGEDVLNGIAYLPESDHLLVTGKRWPYLFEIELVKTD